MPIKGNKVKPLNSGPLDKLLTLQPRQFEQQRAEAAWCSPEHDGLTFYFGDPMLPKSGLHKELTPPRARLSGW
jgi:hypothetical protein